MKKIFLWSIATLCYVLYGCSFEPENELTDLSGIVVRASLEEVKTSGLYPSEEPIVFTGKDILWFNESTKELRFNNNLHMKSVFANFLNVEVIKFYIEGEYAFSCNFHVSGENSQIYNSLVLYYNMNENKYYLLDGYPPISELPEIDQELPNSRPDSTEDIEPEWNTFINQLKKEGRIKE